MIQKLATFVIAIALASPAFADDDTNNQASRGGMRGKVVDAKTELPSASSMIKSLFGNGDNEGDIGSDNDRIGAAAEDSTSKPEETHSADQPLFQRADENQQSDRGALGSKTNKTRGKLPGLSDLLGRKDKTATPQPAEQQAMNIQREKVTGIGGVFFRADAPKDLMTWYEQHLGIAQVPDSYAKEPWTTEAGHTVVAPFARDTEYFGNPSQMWMINFRVQNLDKMITQLRASGIDVTDPETLPNGRFARLQDPEGNPIELWEPAGPGNE